MKIFVSSTIYDLMDVRAELKYMFDQLKIFSKFSEINSSNFIVDYKKSSIETCLNNIKDVDYFIVIIDKRYGPVLSNFGYDNISATHLEYREAVKYKKDILFFVRNNAYADYSIYKKMNDDEKKNFKGNWIKNKNDLCLFCLIDEHIKLKSKDINNWAYFFDNSVDLKETVKKAIENNLLAEKLVERIAFNELPNLTLTCRVTDGYPAIVEGRIKNSGKTTAFVNIIKWKDWSNSAEIKILAPDEAFTVSFRGFDNTLILDYSSYDGINIYDEIAVTVRALDAEHYAHSSLSKGKKYRKGNPVKINLLGLSDN
ncbi:MAG: DUF4062 domain-containing protein [Treponema sp.]|jgi:hypothetical protein|nr:DUF4062 domain-containing protein [Treponema sp.]